MSANLADMTAGYAEPVHGAQQAFRALLDAMSRPGKVVALAPLATSGIVPPPALDASPGSGAASSMSIGTACVLLALLDAQTRVCLAGALGSRAAASYLRFHCGAIVANDANAADFVVARATDLDATLWTRLALGTDDAPQLGATLIVEIAADCDGADPFLPSPGLLTACLRGPGIESIQRLRADALPLAFWRWRIELQAEAPRGIEIVLVHGSRIVAVPRSSRIVLET